MDNGEVIPGLNESWTLVGAKLSEWMAGFMALIIASEVFFPGKMAKSMPALMIVWIGTTFGLAAIRRMYPDEERGLRNHVLVAVGICPPGIPAPSALQPYWSGFPVKKMSANKKFKVVGLDFVFDQKGDSPDEEEFETPIRQRGL